MAPLNEDQIETLHRAGQNVEAAKQAHANAKIAREEAIREVAASGASYREIAHYAGLSYQRVAQLLTGEKGAYFPENGASVVRCPRCEAAPSTPCIDVTKAGKRKERHTHSHHIQRSHRFFALMEGMEEPSKDEPGPLTAIYRPMQITSFGSAAPIGFCYLDPEDAKADVAGYKFNTLGGFVGVWNGQDWQKVEGTEVDPYVGA